MKEYSIADYIRAGCEELDNAAMQAVHGMTGGKVCDTGCHVFNGGGCSAYRNLIMNRKNVQYSETVREEAARREISIKEVRRQRRDATNIGNRG